MDALPSVMVTGPDEEVVVDDDVVDEALVLFDS
jgi:hypothetical protein